MYHMYEYMFVVLIVLIWFGLIWLVGLVSVWIVLQPVHMIAIYKAIQRNPAHTSPLQSAMVLAFFAFWTYVDQSI